MKSIEDDLSELSVTGHLGPRGAGLLDTLGYLVLEAVVSQQELNELRRVFEDAVRKSQAGLPQVECMTGTRHAGGLLAQAEFRRVALDSRVLAAASHVFQRRFVLADIHARPAARLWRTGSAQRLAFAAIEWFVCGRYGPVPAR